MALSPFVDEKCAAYGSDRDILLLHEKGHGKERKGNSKRRVRGSTARRIHQDRSHDQETSHRLQRNAKRIGPYHDYEIAEDWRGRQQSYRKEAGTRAKAVESTPSEDGRRQQ